MSRVSMANAERIATIEAEKKFDKDIEKLEIAFNKLVEAEVIKNYPIPKEVKKLLDDDLLWINTTNDVSIVALEEERSSYSHDMTSYLPCYAKSYLFSIKATGEMKKIFQEIKKKKKEKRDFDNKLESMILSLGTVKKVLENIPELSNHFTQTDKTFLPVAIEQIKSIRKEIVRP